MAQPDESLPAAPAIGAMLQDLGSRIRVLRRERNLTLERLGELSDLSVGIVSQIERGKGNPSFATLVQLAHVSPRFAYGALAAYQAVPRLADDLATLRSARRLRGLREWHPRLVFGLLVRAIRHADQLAIAMDARGFGSRPRSTYRPVAWTLLDALVAAAGVAILVAALLAAAGAQ